jgi:hypothetical protein
MLNIAIKAARAAGAIINRAALDVERAISQHEVAERLRHRGRPRRRRRRSSTPARAYPGHGILAEESGREHGARDSDYVWIIDPLDGTTNFIHGFPVYASASRCFRGARSSRPSSTTRPATTSSTPPRAAAPTSTTAHARLQAHAHAEGVADRHRLSRSARATTSTSTCA